MIFFLGRKAPHFYDLVRFDHYNHYDLIRFLIYHKTKKLIGQHNGHIARLIPQFPSYTFPNHYTMMTGKVPINHGIIGNVFYDDEMQAAFNFKKDSSGEGEQRWWRSEPVSYYFFHSIDHILGHQVCKTVKIKFDK